MKDPRHSKQSRPVAWMALGLATALGVSAFTACNKHVFKVVPADCVKEQQVVQDLATDAPADILIVVDNSGSMCEEQAKLIENFFDPACEIDINQPIPEEYKNPTPEVVEELSERCGFIQILALFDKDFRLGVITTDASQCDNDFTLATNADLNCEGESFEGWGRRPQRGCLQGFGGERKFLQTGDADIGGKFRSILENTRTFGSPFERGLDAVEAFLAPDGVRAPGCENDRESFLRDDAKLVVIFLTDEDDCSDGAPGYPAEMANETCAQGELEVYQGAPADCYDHPERLAPVTRYVEFLQELKGEGNVKVAVIGGALEGTAALDPAGCRVDPGSGAPVGQCRLTGGSSNLTGEGELCGPERVAEEGPCCEADPGTRYYQFARAFGGGNFLENSICYDSFRSTMIDIASFIGRTDSIVLGEKPADPSAIIVKITRAGSDEEEILPRIPDGANPGDQSGWQYDGNVGINFYGDAAPQPGDKLYVAALDTRESDAGTACIAPDFDPSTGGDAGN